VRRCDDNIKVDRVGVCGWAQVYPIVASVECSTYIRGCHFPYKDSSP